MNERIRMVALDLDRTTLKEDGTISERAVRALNRAGETGVSTVIATGRVLGALPGALSQLEYIKYCICSNGAAVFSWNGGRPELIHEKCLRPGAVETMTEFVKEKGYMYESFTEGKAYIGRDYYDAVDRGELLYRSRDYVINTRIPVDDIFEFTLLHKDRIENLNVFFPSQEDKRMALPVLSAIPEATLTSSFPSNYELEGVGVDKGAALEFIMEREGIRPGELMAAGDSPNDITMLKLAGVSVAVENAEDEVREAASYIAPSNEEGGVGEAVERFVLDKQASC